MNRKELEEKYRDHLSKIQQNIGYYLDKTKFIGEEFGGPSKYFHQEAIKESKNDFLGNRHLDMIYAMLPAWGMHEMGDSPVKTVDYNVFLTEINKNKDAIFELRNKNTNEIKNKVVNLLFSMHVSKSQAYLVSSSKVLHHIIPELICPIDRTYSIFLLIENSQYRNEYEKEYADIFLDGMYEFINKNECIMSKYIDNEFNTNLTKIYDNLIIAYKKVLLGKIDFEINVGDSILNISKKYWLLSYKELEKKIESIGHMINESTGKIIKTN